MKNLIATNRPLLGLPSTKPSRDLPAGPTQRPTSTIPSAASKLLSVAVADITYSGSYRSLDEKHIVDLKESIGRIGLTTPISLAAGTSSLILIAGQHRLEAARRLGWTHIDAIRFDANEANNRLVAISENLHRLELCALDRAELQNEWLQAFRDQVGQVAQPAGGHQPSERGISKASRQTGVSTKQLRRAEAIAGIAPEAKAKARELGLHDKQSALLKIAEAETVYQQLKIAADIVEQKSRKPRSPPKDSADSAPSVGRSSLPTVNWAASCGGSVSDDIGIPDFLDRRDPAKAFQVLLNAWNATPQFKVAWADAPPAARSRFATEVLHVGPSKQSEANNAN
jgi:ParB-like chromosome segregation protein Spo0J